VLPPVTEKVALMAPATGPGLELSGDRDEEARAAFGRRRWARNRRGEA